MAAFIDEDVNNPISIHWSLLLQLQMLTDPLWSPNFFRKSWKTVVKYWWFEIFTPRNSVSVFTARTNFLLLVELEDSPLSPCFQESLSWVFSCRLTREYSIGSWLGFRIGFLMPRAPPCLFFFVLRIDGIAQILRRVLPRTERVVQHQIHGSRLHHRRTHWLWFCHLWTFTGSRFLSSLGHGTLLPDRIRKKITEIAAREHREIHDVEQTKKMIPLITRQTLFCQQTIGCWCQHIWLGFWVLNWFCRTTNQAQLCGFWTRVSLLDFVLWWSSWRQPQNLQKCTTETRFEKNVCVGTYSTFENWSTSRLLLSPSLFPETRLVGVLVLVFNYHITEVESR